jgi:segregation and condensation protein A
MSQKAPPSPNVRSVLHPASSAGLDAEQPYHVRLEVFEGPLDLLLHLIEKQELDITKVSLVAVTDQYLDYISHVEGINADNLADFLVVAAKLLLIKSRALLPAPPASISEEEEDVGDELARQLREYKLFKELARQLRSREELGLRAYLRLAALPDLEKKLDPDGVSLEDLLAAAREALELHAPASPVNGVVAPLTISIADRIRRIESLLTKKGSFSFQRLMRRAKSRPEIIVTFLALLELIKARRIQVQQEKLFGEIWVSRPAETAAPVPQQA